MTSPSMPSGSTVASHDRHSALDPESYTAHRLKHATPAHLHATTHRFFIGPIPEGWLNSNRKTWYKRQLELSSYSSRKASFNAATDQGPHHRVMTGLAGPLTAARMSFSFPQPEDVFDGPGGIETADEETDTDTEVETRHIDLVATGDVPRIEGVAEEDLQSHTRSGLPTQHADDPDGPGLLAPLQDQRSATSPAPDSFRSAHEQIPVSAPEAIPDLSSLRDGNGERSGDMTSYRDDSVQQIGQRSPPDNVDANSRTELLTSRPSVESPKSVSKAMHNQDPTPIADDDPTSEMTRTTTGVRFRMSEGVVQGHHRIEQQVHKAKDRVTQKSFKRNTLREGTIVKMERMLVRIDITMQQLSAEFDENERQKVDTRPMEKWREFMVVARKSKAENSEDFRLQMYSTRVIPEIESETTKKKPAREIRLDPKTTHVNLFSSLDKTIVVWHPYKKGTRLFVMRAISTAHGVEWYTFLREALGLPRPNAIQVNVPDLNVTLRIERPFEDLETAGMDARDEETLVARTVAAEQAVAGKIISQCLEMLEGDSEWAAVLQMWHEKEKMGLAWKRYDRLEWIHGMNEQKMYGSMAMQHTHDLELRPKKHYPSLIHNKEGHDREEPTPIEGFLIRLTSQKGLHRRLGKAFFKRLYFSTHNRFLFFNRPAKATPPHPPRLTTISGRDIPTSQEIVEKTPTMFDIEPFKLQDGQVSWLSSGNANFVKQHDNAAYEEARRNSANLSASDGYIDMCDVVRVRPHTWGATPADESLEPGSGSDVDFHEEVRDTRAEDGATKEIEEDRVFELVLTNGLVIRLQAYSKDTRLEWMRRLKQLIRYWKRRSTVDMDIFKMIRRTNLAQLNIDEEQEADLGQFAKKWEVSRSEASPELYNMCTISNCRTIAMSGMLYRKARKYATFHRCGIILTGGQMLIFQAGLRRHTGEQVRNIHQEKMQTVDLQNCYVYSGLIVEDDLLYQNRTFDANRPGGGNLPRIYPDDGWTSADVDVMTCFVVWMNRRKSWFRPAGGDASHVLDTDRGGTRARIKRVGQLGVPGRGMVFKCRSRAERDRWVLSVANEIDRVVEQHVREIGDVNEVRLDR